MPKGICLFSKRILIEGFSFFRSVGIPALGAEFTLLTIAELYLRPGGTVNNRENRARRSYPDKKSLRTG